MSTRLIIDGNAVYEIDEVCEVGKKRLAERTAGSWKQETDWKQEKNRKREMERKPETGRKLS